MTQQVISSPKLKNFKEPEHLACSLHCERIEGKEGSFQGEDQFQGSNMQKFCVIMLSVIWPAGVAEAEWE